MTKWVVPGKKTGGGGGGGVSRGIEDIASGFSRG